MSPTRRSFLKSAAAGVATLPAVPAIAGFTHDAEDSRLILPPRFALKLRASVVERANNEVVSRHDRTVWMAISGSGSWSLHTFPADRLEDGEGLVATDDMSAPVFLDHLAYAITGRSRLG